MTAFYKMMNEHAGISCMLFFTTKLYRYFPLPLYICTYQLVVMIKKSMHPMSTKQITIFIFAADDIKADLNITRVMAFLTASSVTSYFPASIQSHLIAILPITACLRFVPLEDTEAISQSFALFEPPKRKKPWVSFQNYKYITTERK